MADSLRVQFRRLEGLLAAAAGAGTTKRDQRRELESALDAAGAAGSARDRWVYLAERLESRPTAATLAELLAP